MYVHFKDITFKFFLIWDMEKQRDCSYQKGDNIESVSIALDGKYIVAGVEIRIFIFL